MLNAVRFPLNTGSHLHLLPFDLVFLLTGSRYPSPSAAIVRVPIYPPPPLGPRRCLCPGGEAVYSNKFEPQFENKIYEPSGLVWRGG